MPRDITRQAASTPTNTRSGLSASCTIASRGEARGSGRLVVANPDHPGLAPLPAAADDVPDAERRLVESQATESALATALDEHRWRVVHLGCHGQIDPERPLRSALALTPGASSDGLWTVGEILRAPVPADVVVLAACSSGQARSFDQEGRAGFVHAFFVAGAKQVVVSLWDVDDAATSLLMQAFHRERMEFLAKTEADYFALETIPTIFEGISCLAIAGDLNELPVMLTFSCRDGTHLCSGHPMSHVSEVVNQGTFWFLVGVGMNCTAPRHIVSLLNEIAARETAPMVVYPNSGEDWDAKHRCWVGENDADHFAEHAREWIKAGANIIGGCCRTGPEHISRLRALVDALN